MLKKMDILNNLKIIIQIRDPRDCITSGYFSFSKSHVAPKDPNEKIIFEAQREEIKNLTIGEYALSRAKQYKVRMEILSQILKNHNEVLLLAYENMVENTEQWLKKVSDFLEQPLTESLYSRLDNKIDFTVAKEDDSKHKRQVLPGDYRRKLKPETIQEINNVLDMQLNEFCYEK
jgi:hypothetical protein